MIKDNLVFLREFLTEFQKTGSIFPTSRWAAEALTNPIDKPRPSQNILELGPGTGSVTVQVLEKMVEGDHLTICEINPRFMKALKKKLAKNELFQRHQKRIRFFEGPAQDLPEDIRYDVIVCAIPFLNLDVAAVHEIFEKLRKIGKENAVMTYYEYIGLRSLSKSVASKQTKQRMRELDDYLHTVTDEWCMGRKRVWLNLLPINIYTLQFAA